jgi:hypothetical protein
LISIAEYSDNQQHRDYAIELIASRFMSHIASSSKTVQSKQQLYGLFEFLRTSVPLNNNALDAKPGRSNPLAMIYREFLKHFEE